MTEKRFVKGYHTIRDTKENNTYDFHVNIICDLLNKLDGEIEKLKQDNFICLDCKHSGYTEIGCLCEKEDHWTDYKTECEDYEELE